MGRAPFLGVHLHHAASQVSVFGRWYSGDDLYALDVLHAEAAGAYSAHAGKGGVVSHAHAVDLHGGGKCGVTYRLPSCAEGKGIFSGEVRIQGLSSGKKGRDAAHAAHLEVVQGRPANGLGGVEIVLGFLCRDNHFLEGQVARREAEGDVAQVSFNVEGTGFRCISQAGYFYSIRALLDIFHQKTAVCSGDRPEIVLVQPYYSTRNGRVATGFQHFSAHADGLGCP